MTWAAPNGTDLDNYALFGAPGCFTWRGNLYGRLTGWWRMADERWCVGWPVTSDPPGSIRETAKAATEENFLEFRKHGHLGAAMASGRFFGGSVQHAAGAPNVVGGEGTGEVQFYERTARDKGLARLEGR